MPGVKGLKFTLCTMEVFRDHDKNICKQKDLNANLGKIIGYKVPNVALNVIL